MPERNGDAATIASVTRVPRSAHNGERIAAAAPEQTTGSFNFTRSAEIRNVEDLVLISLAAVAEQFVANWTNRRGRPVYGTDMKSAEQKKHTWRIILLAGGVSRVAEALAISPQAVSQWTWVSERPLEVVSKMSGKPASFIRPDLSEDYA